MATEPEPGRIPIERLRGSGRPDQVTRIRPSKAARSYVSDVLNVPCIVSRAGAAEPEAWLLICLTEQWGLHSIEVGLHFLRTTVAQILVDSVTHIDPCCLSRLPKPSVKQRLPWVSWRASSPLLAAGALWLVLLIVRSA